VGSVIATAALVVGIYFECKRRKMTEEYSKLPDPPREDGVPSAAGMQKTGYRPPHSGSKVIQIPLMHPRMTMMPAQPPLMMYAAMNAIP
jgi:hypothetical protein